MHESLAFVRSYHPSLSQFDAHELNQLRQTLLAAEPEIYHDVTVWRHRALELGMRNAGLSAEAAKRGPMRRWNTSLTGAAASMFRRRPDTLAKLAEKWPLVAITNGNARTAVATIPLRAARRAGWPLKPFADMYHLAAERLMCRSGRFCTSAMI